MYYYIIDIRKFKQIGALHMKRTWKVIIVLLILSISSTVFAEVIFTDLAKDWAYDSIYLAVGEKLVEGYEDGSYRPHLQITEEEFVAVLARFVKDTDKSKFVKEDGVHWSQPYYDELVRFQIPLKGYNNTVAKKTALTRGEIARAVAAKNGFNLTERRAIYYIYENDIS